MFTALRVDGKRGDNVRSPIGTLQSLHSFLPLTRFRGSRYHARATPTLLFRKPA